MIFPFINNKLMTNKVTSDIIMNIKQKLILYYALL